MRTEFRERLDSLTATLSQMCGLAGVAMEQATEAILQADLRIAETVIAGQDRLAAMKSDAEDESFSLLALQAPVAADLRLVVGSMQNVADAERMGGLARHVAQIARRRHPDQTLPSDVTPTFARMGEIAADLGSSAQAVVRSRDPKQAAQIACDDEAMDELHQHLFTLLGDANWAHGVASAVDIALLGRFYERFADHAVEIGRRVIFQATGETRNF